MSQHQALGVKGWSGPDNVGHLGVLLVFRQENSNISTAFCPGECHMELSMREDWDPEVNTNASN